MTTPPQPTVAALDSPVAAHARAVCGAGTLMSEVPENCKLVAVYDGAGESASWLLTVESSDGEIAAILTWPDDWPERVNADFLTAHGYKCITA